MNKHSKKSLTYVLLVAVLLAGIYYAYHEGLLPGIGQGRKTADELKTRIEALQGNNIENKIYGLMAKSPVAAGLLGNGEDFAKEWDVSLSYSELIPSSEDGNGVVEMVKPVLSLTHATRGIYQITAPTLIIAQEPGKDHYLYRVEGDIEVNMDFVGNGETTKMLAIKSEQNGGEAVFEDGKIVLQKFSAKNIKFIESKGNTTLASVATVESTNTQKVDKGMLKATGTAAYTGIEPGDMVKLFVGHMEPMNISYDYSYEGAEAELAGKLDVKKLSVKFGDAGLDADAKLEFEKGKKEPVGNAYVKIIKYAKLISFPAKYYSVNPAENTSVKKFLMESGADEGEDVSFDFEFNGTNKVRINGKSQDEMEALFEKHFPEGNPQEKPVKPEAMPIEKTPEVERRKL